MSRPFENAFAFLLSIGLVGAIGCTGAVGDSGGGMDPAPPATAGSGGNGGSGPVTPSPDTGLWRLTRTEYNNTIRDLLGDTSHVTTLDADPTFQGFDNNAALLKNQVFPVEKYDDVASEVVDNAFRARSAALRRFLTCDPVAGGAPCARKNLSAFAERAWRRPVEGAEVDRLMGKALGAAQGDGMEEVLKLAFRMVLVSPSFLYRVEDGTADAKGLHPVRPHELATRMSYFLWSRAPDDELLKLADDGSLSRPEVLAAQLGRMLRDPKADALVDNFAAQWLDTRRLADPALVPPDRKVFPSFYSNGKTEELRQAMIAEPLLFFRAFLNEERDVADMLDADFTFANERLASHYGMSASTITGPAMRQVPVAADGNRFGLLSQANMLMLTSLPTRTNIPRRARWVLTRLLCSPPPDPPADAGQLASDPSKVGLPTVATVRQVLEEQTKGERCALCHTTLNPIGFGLEHYDAIGMWRSSYRGGVEINAKGELPGGVTFDGAREMSRKLKDDPRFVRCISSTVFSYALGRDPTAAAGDRAAVDRLATAMVHGGGHIRDLFTLVASSNAFVMRGGQQP